MIDMENLTFSTVASALRTTFPGIFVSGEYTTVPASFPAVTIVEVDNRVLQRMSTPKIEDAAQVTYEVNVYSNLTTGKKAQAKTIINEVDDQFRTMGFTRTFREQVPNLADATIYRIVARYEGVVTCEDIVDTTSGEKTGEEFTVYQKFLS